MLHWYRGPWRWVEQPFFCWAPPVGCSGLDLRSLPEQSQAGGTPGLGIFCGETEPDKVGADYDLLGTGDWTDVKADQKLIDTLPAPSGYTPQGDTLARLLWDLLTGASDPEGLEFARPLMPTMERKLELCVGGSRHSESFKWGAHPHTAKCQAIIRSDFAKLLTAAQAGQLKDAVHHLRVLDSWCEKHGVSDWKEFVPLGLQQDVPGRVKHETTISDNFTGTDGDTIGNLLSWTEYTNAIAGGASSAADAWDRASNAAAVANDNPAIIQLARAESDLSSDDHYADIVLTSVTSLNDQLGPVTRFQNGGDNNNGYIHRAIQVGDAVTVSKLVNGTPGIVWAAVHQRWMTSRRGI